jgi:phosphoglycolate phosphatase
MAHKAAHLQNGTVYIDPAQIKLMIFDKDGTLSDLNMWIEIIKQRARLLGEHFELSENNVDDIIRAMGADPYSTNILDVAILTDSRPTTEKKVIKKLIEFGLKKDEAHESTHRIFGEVDSIVDLRKIANPLGDIRGLFENALEHNIKIAIATSDLAIRCEKILEAFDVLDQVHAISGADSITNDKPAPDMVHYVCERLEIKPEHTAVVGDSTLDMEMAKNAGCGLSIAVLTGKDGADLLEPFADFIVQSIDNIKVR